MKTDDLYGLVLMGGKSRRLGFDKSVIPYHGKPQSQHLYELMNEILAKVFVSVRKDQEGIFTDKTIEDGFSARGPLNGLLSAHRAFPDKAWLVLAVDMPFITPRSILSLVKQRSAEAMATAYLNPERGTPEPLLAIWEPKALAKLMNHHLRGEDIYPTRFLLNNSVNTLRPMEDVVLFNVNTPTDFEKAKKVIDQLH